jgi:hypothetical protein
MSPAVVSGNVSGKGGGTLAVSWAIAGPATTVSLSVDGVPLPAGAVPVRNSSSGGNATVDTHSLARGKHRVCVTANGGWSRFRLAKAERDVVEEEAQRRQALEPSMDCVSFELN